MYNPEKPVVSFNDWCEASITDFHDRSEALVKSRGRPIYTIPTRRKPFVTKIHLYIVLLFLSELQRELTSLTTKRVLGLRPGKLPRSAIIGLRQKIKSIYGGDALDELDFLTNYSKQLNSLRRITPELAAMHFCYGINCLKLKDDPEVSYLNYSNFVSKTAEELSDITRYYVDPHIQWLIGESGLQDVL